MSLFYLNPHSFPLIQSAILIKIIGALVRKQSPRQESSRLFYFICCVVSVWFLGSILVYSSRDAKTAEFIYRLVTFLGVSHVATFVYQFSVAWLGLRGWRRKIGVISQHIGTCFYILVLITPSAFEGMRLHAWGYAPRYGVLPKAFMTYFFIIFFLSFSNFVIAYLKSKLPTHRNQIRLMLIAFSISFVSSTEYLHKVTSSEFYPIGFAATFIWIAIVAYGLIRYQIFNIQDITRIAQDMRFATLGMMSASLSHEVKNPIYAMKGRAEVGLNKLEQQEKLSIEEGRQICETVIKQSDRVLDIVRHFSQFARNGMDSKLRIESTNLSEVLETIQPFVQHKMMRGRVRMEVLFPSDMPQVKIDSRRMEEVFINLILNACQSMEDKVPNPKIEISAKIFNKEVRVSFRDNGPGFLADQKDKIFEPFYTTKTDGMGLGLFISKQLIEEMDARIEIGVSDGEGANFILVLKEA